MLFLQVIEEGNAMLQNLQILNMQPQICLRYVWMPFFAKNKKKYGFFANKKQKK